VTLSNAKGGPEMPDKKKLPNPDSYLSENETQNNCDFFLKI
jgi:hypothetical protein